MLYQNTETLFSFSGKIQLSHAWRTQPLVCQLHHSFVWDSSYSLRCKMGYWGNIHETQQLCMFLVKTSLWVLSITFGCNGPHSSTIQVICLNIFLSLLQCRLSIPMLFIKNRLATRHITHDNCLVAIGFTKILYLNKRFSMV